MPSVTQKALLDKLAPFIGREEVVTVTFSAGEIAELVHLLENKPEQRMIISHRNRNVLVSAQDDYSVHEVADLLGVTPQAIYKWIEQGKIQAVRSSANSRDMRIPKDQIKFVDTPSEAFLKNRREMFGSDRMKLSDPNEIFRSDEGSRQ